MKNAVAEEGESVLRSPIRASRDRIEWTVVALCTVIGALIRGWGFSRLGITHFDEGIYAMAGLWPLLDGGLGAVGERLAPYAGPGFPGVIGLLYLGLGVSDRAAILAAELAGIATIPVSAWVARRAFGPGAAAAASALVALSGMHVAFSRMALTDTTFLLLWLLAMGLGGRCLEKPSWGRAIGFGATIGLGQNVKYVAWLAGFSFIATALLGLLIRRRTDINRAKVAGCLVLGTTIAALVYLPWFLYVDQHGGYSRLLAHQRSYVGGWSSWQAHWKAHLAQVVALSGGLPWAFSAGGLAVIGTGLALGLPGSRWPRLVLIAVGVGAALGLLPTLSWWVAVAWLPSLLRSPRPSVRMLAVAFLVLSILTPMYHPYARLWLPLLGMGWVVIGGLLAQALSRFGTDTPIPREGDALDSPIPVPPPVWLLVCLMLLLVQWGVLIPGARPLPGLLAPSDRQRQIVQELTQVAPASENPIILLTRPTAPFYLSTLAPRPFRIVSGLEPLLEMNAATVLVDEALLRQESDPDRALQRLFERYEPDPAGTWTETLTLPTWLDLMPEVASGSDRPREVTWWLLYPRTSTNRGLGRSRTP